MSDILADYREWRDQQAARVSTHSAGCHMWHRDCMIDRLADALGRARLTDEEREAIRWAIDKTARTYDDAEGGPIKRESLRTLLERTK
jgi:hypothetical protein